MSIEVTLLLSVITICITLYFSSKREKRDSYHSIEEKAKNEAKMEVMLNEISNNVKDVKYDMTSVKKELGKHSEEIALIKQRLDTMDNESNN